MLSNFLINKFIDEPNDTDCEYTRTQYGLLGGFIGVACNLLLFAIKVTLALITSSVSILADAFNNLSDCTASIVTIIGFKLSNKPPNKKFPFGYGRVEFISGLIVSFMVMLFGFDFLQTSFDKLLNPETTSFSMITFIILLASTLIKLWLANLNNLLGEKINSSALKASALDAKGDILTSLSVAISFFTTQFVNFPIDAICGMLVSIGIIYSGFNLTKETVTPLLGEAPSEELVNSIKNILFSYEEILNIHDLVIHNYGINKYMASVHAEMPESIGALHMHEVADEAEREVFNKLNVLLVIHTDPVCTNDEETIKCKEEVCLILSKNENIISFHDFRVVGEHSKKNLIFDIVVKSSFVKTIKDENKLKYWIAKEVKSINPGYNCVITIDRDFSK